jgi:alpha-glucosidase
MKTLKNWTLDKQSANHLELLVDNQHRLSLYVLEENLFRVLIERKGGLALNRTWSIAPKKDVPWEGRDRHDLSGFTCPAWRLTHQDDVLKRKH